MGNEWSRLGGALATFCLLLATRFKGADWVALIAADNLSNEALAHHADDCAEMLQHRTNDAAKEG